jgi:3-methylcrotonyl-CoA carboxylase alpha subunit
MTRISKDSIVGTHRFAKILIANRGEIACRIIRTAKRLGIRTVAVYSEADAKAAHVDMADEAWPIGPAPARESYLNIEAIIDVARKAGVDAIHPGYGFLSEKADFAAACTAAGFIFIGPPAAAIKAMGDKAEAKRIMAAASVPVVPGYHEEDQSKGALKAAARQIGYPILIKAAAGGGGKGMRIVEEESKFSSAMGSAQREALSAFGDDRIILEKFLRNPRHIEVQVFGDNEGNVIHLFDRDCSIQRRYQKVIEEAPAPGLTESTRLAMHKAAVSAAKAINYVSAGTIEFIYADEQFYFMEMNTRLQVEHPVTELITRIDLVEWQIDVAAGLSLPLRQEDVTSRGHAIEARLYAEDPYHQFLPSTGKISHLRLPDQSADLWVDSGVRQGDEVTVYYDPMIAKIISWDEDRSVSADLLREALLSVEVAGPITNASFLAAIVDHPAFRLGEVSTQFISKHSSDLLPPVDPPFAVWALAAISRLDQSSQGLSRGDDFYSPWSGLSGWRLNGDPSPICIKFKYYEHEEIVFISSLEKGKFSFSLGNNPTLGTYQKENDRYRFSLGSSWIDGRVVQHGNQVTVFYQGKTYRLVIVLRDDIEIDSIISDGTLLAMMPGKVVSVSAVVGQKTQKGDILAVMEAMKMEQPILAPFDGVVAQVLCRPGDIIAEGTRLVVLEENVAGDDNSH